MFGIKIITEGRYDRMVKDQDSYYQIEKVLNQAWKDVRTDDGWGYYGGFDPHYGTTTIVNAISRLSKLYKDTAKIYNDYQNQMRNFEYERSEMQKTIDEQAEYITKMQKAYYISEQLMEANK